ncbi:glycoside hydrolase family 5 protein [Xylariaceae sp. FL1019]|nr:glycoside hydrolase family 5 protein [Xylariaceae sp. FL1019]
MRVASLLATAAAVVPALAVNLPLSSSSRWILDADGARVKLTCINWSGHLESNLPEGLNKQSIDTIASFVADQGFNCVRLTYSIDYALNPTMKISDAIANAATATGFDTATWDSIYNDIKTYNSFAEDGTLQDAYSAVIASLWSKGVMTILDNHVSKASWCCDLDDGNGWWDEAHGYIAANSRYFNTQNWYDGLSAMATWSNSQAGVIGMSLRNEIREFPILQNTGSGSGDWAMYVTEAAKLVHAANPDLLVVIGGTASATVLTQIESGGMIDWSEWAGKHVWEWHAYEFTVTFALTKSDCGAQKDAYGLFDGFVLKQDEDYTAPLILSEFGFAQAGGDNSGVSDDDWAYFTCLKEYMLDNDSEWAIWTLQGSYYHREGTIDHDEGFGVLNHDWTGLRNPELPTILGDMFNATQGP